MQFRLNYHLFGMYCLYPPSPILSDFIDCFWESSFESVGQGIYQELYVAQYNPNIIFNISKNYQRNDDLIIHSTAVTVNTHAIQFTHLFDNQLFGIRFKTGALRLFSTLALHETTDSVPLVADIFGDKRAILEDKIQNAQTTAQRIAITEGYLLAQLITNRLEKFKLTQHVLQHIRLTSHQTDCITQLPHTAHLTQRSIDRYFQEYLGLSPKKMSRLVRFEQSFAAIHQSTETFYFHDFGYYDHAHFCKEFREFVGMSLQTYLDSPFFVQNLQSKH